MELVGLLTQTARANAGAVRFLSTDSTVEATTRHAVPRLDGRLLVVH